MITYLITVREHETGHVIEQEKASGNTPMTAYSAKMAIMRQLDFLYPSTHYVIDCRKESGK